MPKHGWKWRTERIRELSEDQLRDLLQRHDRGAVSAKLARWVFENLGDEMPFIRFTALERIAYDDRCLWGMDYLWNLLPAYKRDPFGDWIVIALTRGTVTDPTRDIERFINLYEDEAAHPMARGSAIFGISNVVMVADYEYDPKLIAPNTSARMRATCASAIADRNPYARAGAGWLAQRIGGFDEELAVLAKDRTGVFEGGGMTVAEYADGWV